ncbi:hypothetical protein DID75_00900 [Candidatus Marinamargulisbacteria bacterium SCGC AG-410-N11]|nr:hypothetical protein DID75_00900 [Candidatus Marinamargulisbacteria bacterium SCGC AG-410-N11]
MKRPIKALKDETLQIEEMLIILEVLCHKLEDGEEVNVKDLQKVINFFKVFAEECHNKKEEEFLFPEYKKCPKQEAQHRKEVIDELKGEHQLGKFYLIVLGKMISKIQRGDKSCLKKFTQISRKYIDLECRHINLEFTELYPICEKTLSVKQKDTIGHQFDMFEDKTFGEGQHDNFHCAINKMITNLKSVYLGSGSSN